jgi:predicted nuclease of predicted toxin-antitoxin system
MKFLADMPISPKTVMYLRSLGHDVYRISEKGLYRAKDHDIVEIAVIENRVILTMDLDFAAIIAISHMAIPSTVIFRVMDESYENINALLENILPRVEKELLGGAIVIIEDDRFRVRSLPI